MKKYPFKLGDRVMTPDGRGTVVCHDIGVDRPGVIHDIFPLDKPKIYKKNILYYFKSDFDSRYSVPFTR
jgi:hypothetical protein